ncbi:substrate-binding domain-containing protein [Halobacillus karajensis]|uniref:D-ribose-binding periplasmic protein n=1 Tax=Halobacillus karajensis TaxID=195088 RepID=A0A024P9M7_9BACI|nr:substrate-binding domain-containing protein [Halobacillus karajensis]CDQ21365.1 D-ribose-binding periplasmic protein precursor [Halobacillus karajensis]CDQ25563.1 D-ribose-binding periplasmic protein precursor [Halobacillus karajensis]CDQ25834.1 D-ribose-binding periplasmic protein precursor [Halobacillus karajensis]
MRLKFVTGLFVLITLLVAGCSAQKGSGDEIISKDIEMNVATEPITINPDIPESKIYSEGPHGEEAVSAHTLELTVEETKEISEGDYTAAIAMHYAGNDWSRAQIHGLKQTFAKMGVEVIAVTDGQFSVEKQASDIETLLARDLDVLISVPVDPVSTASAYRKAEEAGVELVFMDNVPKGFSPGEDYVSVVSADNYGNGVIAAHSMAKELDEKGEIGVIYHDADYFVTEQRVKAFEKTINEEYPDIKIVEREGIGEPEDGERVANAMLTRNADLDGLFVVWDVPAEGALAAARSAALEDLVITTIDLGSGVALDMARNQNIKGIGAQLPYDQGVAEAILAGYALLDKEAPPYVAVPPLEVTRNNLLESWELVYNEKVPPEIQGEMEKK